MNVGFQIMKNCLAGALSQVKIKPANVRFIGPLSRFEISNVPQKYDLLISLSGPEPKEAYLKKLLFLS